MPTTSSPPANDQDLISAYRALGLELGASPLAIRHRYRELAQIHHPDKWPQGSSEQARAAERMREINAAYDLIEDAPLQHRQVASEPDNEPIDEAYRHAQRSRRDWLTRIDLKAFVNFLYGVAAGAALMFWLRRRGTVENPLLLLLVPVLVGFLFARVSWLSRLLLEEIMRWTRGAHSPW
jgi:hypothetical protein